VSPKAQGIRRSEQLREILVEKAEPHFDVRIAGIELQ